MVLVLRLYSFPNVIFIYVLIKIKTVSYVSMNNVKIKYLLMMKSCEYFTSAHNVADCNVEKMTPYGWCGSKNFFSSIFALRR